MSAADGVLLGLFFATGAIVGSFANVCIHRLPRGDSVVHPGSHCPACGAPIAFYDNVPVVSWLVLRGRCRRCGAPIDTRYPAVEMLVALLFLAAGLLYGPTLVAASAALLGAGCVILAATDLEARTLPDEVTFGTLGCGLLLAALRDRAARGPDRSFASPVRREPSLRGAPRGVPRRALPRRSQARLREVAGPGRAWAPAT